MRTTKKRLLIGSLSALAVTTLSGCIATNKVENSVDLITNPSYIVPMAKSEHMPSKEELAGRRSRVVVLPVKFSGDTSYQTNAIKELSALIENGLLRAPVELVDRKLANKLGDEIVAYEATGRYAGGDLNVADIAIMTVVNNVSIGGAFTGTTTYTDDGVTKYIPSYCTYTAKLTGNVRIYQMPDLSILDTFPLEGMQSSNQNSNDSNCRVSTAQSNGVATMASATAVDNVLHNIQNIFSGSAYVVEYRKRLEEHYVMVSMGSNQSIKPGMKVQFYRKVEITHPMTGDKTISELPYDFSGTVLEGLVEAGSAWVKLPEEAETQIRMGDIAKVHFEEMGFWEKATKGMKMPNMF